MSRPSSISGTDGSRIKLIFGTSGSDYLLLLDEEDADGLKWQTREWTTGGGGLPSGLASQLNNLPIKGRHATQVAFGPNGEWFVSGCKRDGTGAYTWWGGSLHSDSIREKVKDASDNKVSFGDGDTCVIITGRNGYWWTGDVDSNLTSRMERINSANKTIECVRLIRGHGSSAYFISDDEGTEWKSLGDALSNELRNGGSDPVLDVAVASDGSWIVLRPNRFSSSTGVSNEITLRLAQFYREQKARREARNAKIRAYDARVVREAEEQRQADEQRRQAEEAMLAEEARKKAVEDARKRAEELSLKRRSEQDLIETITAKRLRHGVQVTAVGRSFDLGDSFVVSTDEHGVKVKCPDGSSFSAADPQQLLKIVPYVEHEENAAMEELQLVYMASDKYEAAISVYHCACTHNGCVCTRTAFATTASGSSALRARPLAWVYSPEPRRRFDEYICAEKLDRRRLQQIIKDLRTDEAQRKAFLTNIEARLRRTSTPQLVEHAKLLKRCRALSLVADTLNELTQELVEDSYGFVIHEVVYEHKDASFRGRLFAKGTAVSVTDDKYPRTATLQSMQRDLRQALVGEFAHDVDCENSEYRLICSLAEQLQLEHLVPTVLSYCNDRKTWLDKICQQHSVTKDEAKRLPNIILSSGIYKTWLRLVNRTAGPSHDIIRKFANDLAAEIRALRHELLQHPRFAWTAISREEYRRKGKAEGTIDALLLPRIVQSCENEVLGIIHRSLYDSGWYAIAKVFDGLIVEPAVGKGIETHHLERALADATTACKRRGWNVVLAEKSLHGLQDEPLATIAAAREVIRQL
jgi:hypothetical protein